MTEGHIFTDRTELDEAVDRWIDDEIYCIFSSL